MPFYEYACTNCGLVHAELRKVDERDEPRLNPCECGCASTERVMSPTPGVVTNPAVPRKYK